VEPTHSVHELVSIDQYFPMLHKTQLEYPFPDAWFIGQSSHAVLPIDSLYFPIVQAVHSCALLLSNPTLHTQAIAPDTEFEFDGQSEHIPFPEASLNFPATHDWH
jgi:hypothetical protein